MIAEMLAILMEFCYVVMAMASLSTLKSLHAFSVEGNVYLTKNVLHQIVMHCACHAYQYAKACLISKVPYIVSYWRWFYRYNAEKI